MMELWAGSASGTVAYACWKRRPRAAIALNAGVSTPVASGPIASARVVSSVTSRIDGRTPVAAGAPDEGDGARLQPDPHMRTTAAASVDHEPEKRRGIGSLERGEYAVTTISRRARKRSRDRPDIRP